MTCSELTDFLLAYLANELPAEQRRTFDAHLAICPDCRRYLDSYRKTVEMSKSALRHTPRSTRAANPGRQRLRYFLCS